MSAELGNWLLILLHQVFAQKDNQTEFRLKKKLPQVVDFILLLGVSGRMNIVVTRDEQKSLTLANSIADDHGIPELIK